MPDGHEPRCSGACGADEPPQISRRSFLAGGTTAMTAIAAGITGASPAFIATLLHENFREMSPPEMDRVIAEMEREYSEKYGKDVTVSRTGAQPGVLFGYGLTCRGASAAGVACTRACTRTTSPAIPRSTGSGCSRWTRPRGSS